jgi:two-component system, sensor histidine kinase PdtaS
MAAQTPTYSEEAALSLTMAVVASSPGPLLLLDGDLSVIAASVSFSETFEIDAESAPGRPLSSLGSGEWNTPQLRSLLDATVSGAAKIEAFEIDFKRPGHGTHRLIVHAQRLVYLDMENLRLLVAVTDVTEARADAKLKDNALRENLVLLQEVRHRVANSLQIIASVLLQNAKRTLSDETRGHLKDAHHRVMSVAELERQLAGTGDGQVELLTYLTSLCDSIASSMIADPDQLSLVVTGPGGVVQGRTSVSLGLIVTELVINALKHAFPGDRAGKITVDCEFGGPNWVLSVADNGVGMPRDPVQIRAGLGTSIVQALAAQLEATIHVEPAHPGTRVSITRARVALATDRDGATSGAPAAARPAAEAVSTTAVS